MNRFHIKIKRIQNIRDLNTIIAIRKHVNPFPSRGSLATAHNANNSNPRFQSRKLVNIHIHGYRNNSLRSSSRHRQWTSSAYCLLVLAPSSESAFNFPFAAAPDIIRSNQKDAYYQGVLLEQISTILRKVYGARILHKYTLETKTLADILYLTLTTLRGARTLGEEYCDILHVECKTLRLPGIKRRAGFILTTILVPYFLTKLLPRFRSRIRQKLQSATAQRNGEKQGPDSVGMKVKKYLLENLDTLTSTESLLAVHLGMFYFTGAYYHLSKRIWGLRYIFTKRLAPHEQRVGYEVLGLLLLAQLATQGYFHISNTFSHTSAITADEEAVDIVATGGVLSNPETHVQDADRDRAMFDLDNEKTMRFMSGEMGRKLSGVVASLSARFVDNLRLCSIYCR
ncbi:uncharacterized protein LAJ45_08543 [Morchella importuna]|uniref:uncharacterized protein n=1 Tax=Morchella importuna TaxID=1174673 RepID=UPI001E8E2621|nr:uncharacterized protein LAJ45_08543 [Morchella importuna]KAH8147387.1 hypothetical protein LAJ45_08543 [Morchella importuna]